MGTTVLLDLDGTLLYAPSKILRVGFLALFFVKSILLGVNPFKMLNLLSKLRTELERPRLREETNQVLIRSMLATELNLSLTQAEELFTTITDFCFSGMRPIFSSSSSAIDFVNWCRTQNFRLILATNPMWPKSVTLKRLSWSGVDDKDFEFISTAENMQSCKPTEQYYRELCRKLSLMPEECIMVGNDIKKDGPAGKLNISVFILSPSVCFSDVRRYLEAKNV